VSDGVNQRVQTLHPPTEQADNVAEYLAGRVPTIRADLHSAVRILQDGKFRSQFETRTSNGSYAPVTRMDWEDRHWGYSPNSPTRARPIYGYMASPDPTEDKTESSQYGEVSFRLDPERVRHHSTVTWGDSLGPGVRPVRYDDAVAGRVPDRFAPEYSRADEEPPAYAELQVHGGADLRDVKDVHIGLERGSGDWYGDLRSALVGRGVPFQQSKPQESYTQGRMFLPAGRVLEPGGPLVPIEEPTFSGDTDFDSNRFKVFSWGDTKWDRLTTHQWSPGMSAPIERKPYPDPRDTDLGDQARWHREALGIPEPAKKSGEGEAK
jgi:hypothetical protein